MPHLGMHQYVPVCTAILRSTKFSTLRQSGILMLTILLCINNTEYKYKPWAG
jgi:hypothetical protein